MLARDVSDSSSEGGTLDMGTKGTLRLYLASTMGIREEHMGWNNLFPEGRGVPASLYTNTPKVRARTHTMAPFPSTLHYTNSSLSSSGGATTTRFPRAPLAAGSAPPICRLAPGCGVPALRQASPPGHSLPLPVIGIQRNRFPGLGESHFPSPQSSVVPRACCPPHGFSMVPVTPFQ